MADEKLKREISKRWPFIRSDVTAFAQLEYILTEAGLLSKRRLRRVSRNLISNKPQTTEPTQPQHTLD